MIGNLWQDTGNGLQDYFCSGKHWIPKTKTIDGTTTTHISESLSINSKSGEYTSTHDLKQENQDLKLQLPVLAAAPCIKGLTYISRMLRLLSLSMEGINPHERERHISERMTLSRGLNSASISTTLYVMEHFLILHDPCIKQRQSQTQVCKWSLESCSLVIISLNSHRMRM